jgi:hypothetical protein
MWGPTSSTCGGSGSPRRSQPGRDPRAPPRADQAIGLIGSSARQTRFRPAALARAHRGARHSREGPCRR